MTCFINLKGNEKNKRVQKACRLVAYFKKHKMIERILKKQNKDMKMILSKIKDRKMRKIMEIMNLQTK